MDKFNKIMDDNWGYIQRKNKIYWETPEHLRKRNLNCWRGFPIHQKDDVEVCDILPWLFQEVKLRSKLDGIIIN